MTGEELRKKVLDEKKRFTENELSACLVAANINIARCEFEYVKGRGEYVRVVFKNGYRKLIDVSGDSLLSMIRDVTRNL